MTLKEFKAEMVKDEVRMAGDRFHNEMITYFLNGVKQSPVSRKIQAYIVKQFKESDQRWIMNIFSKGEMRVLSSICKAKSAKTLEKRKLMFIRDLTKSVYGCIFNKGRINDFVEMFEMEV